MSSDLIIQSNKNSVLLNTISKDPEDLSYEVQPSFPMLVKNLRAINPNNGTGAIVGHPTSQEVVFNINRSNLLRNLMVQTSYSVTTGGIAVAELPGLQMFEWVQLRSNNKVIMTMSDAYIMARSQDSSVAKSTAIYRRALHLSETTFKPAAATTETGLTTFTPIFSSFFEDSRNHLDLNFYEQLQLACKYNIAARGGLTKELIAITSCKLWVWSYQLESTAYDLLRAKNQRPNEKLNMLTYNTYLEKTTGTGTISNQTVFMHSNYPVFKTYVFMRNNTAPNAFVNISSFDFTVGGVKLYESLNKLVATYEQEIEGSSGIVSTTETAISRVSENIICINWGMLPNDRTKCSGAVSFSNLNNPSITVYGSITTGVDIFIVHEYWNILSLDSSNGVLELTSTS
jgi:hypothetical protein